MGKGKCNMLKERGGKERGKKRKGVREVESRQITSISRKLLEQIFKQFNLSGSHQSKNQQIQFFLRANKLYFTLWQDVRPYD